MPRNCGADRYPVNRSRLPTFPRARPQLVFRGIGPTPEGAGGGRGASAQEQEAERGHGRRPWAANALVHGVCDPQKKKRWQSERSLGAGDESVRDKLHDYKDELRDRVMENVARVESQDD